MVPGVLIALILVMLRTLWKHRSMTRESGDAPQWRGTVVAERIHPFHETLPSYRGLLFVVGDELRFRPLMAGLLEEEVVAQLSAQAPDDLARGVVLGRKGASTIRLTLPVEARSLLSVPVDPAR